MEDKTCHNVTWKSGCFSAPEGGDFAFLSVMFSEQWIRNY